MYIKIAVLQTRDCIFRNKIFKEIEFYLKNNELSFIYQSEPELIL